MLRGHSFEEQMKNHTQVRDLVISIVAAKKLTAVTALIASIVLMAEV